MISMHVVLWVMLNAYCWQIRTLSHAHGSGSPCKASLRLWICPVSGNTWPVEETQSPASDRTMLSSFQIQTFMLHIRIHPEGLFFVTASAVSWIFTFTDKHKSRRHPGWVYMKQTESWILFICSQEAQWFSSSHPVCTVFGWIKAFVRIQNHVVMAG